MNYLYMIDDTSTCKIYLVKFAIFIESLFKMFAFNPLDDVSN